MSIKSLLDSECYLCFISKLFGAVEAEQQIKWADVNYLLYCIFVQKEPVMDWFSLLGFEPAWVTLRTDLPTEFLLKKANLFIVIPNLFLAYEILKISKLYIIPLGKIWIIFAELDIPHIITPKNKNYKGWQEGSPVIFELDVFVFVILFTALLPS